MFKYILYYYSNSLKLINENFVRKDFLFVFKYLQKCCLQLIIDVENIK